MKLLSINCLSTCLSICLYANMAGEAVLVSGYPCWMGVVYVYMFTPVEVSALNVSMWAILQLIQPVGPVLQQWVNSLNRKPTFFLYLSVCISFCWTPSFSLSFSLPPPPPPPPPSLSLCFSLLTLGFPALEGNLVTVCINRVTGQFCVCVCVCVCACVRVCAHLSVLGVCGCYQKNVISGWASSVFTEA